MRLLILVIALCSSAFAADEPVPLAVVKTWSELAAQPAIKLDGGGTVRLGIEALKAPLNGGVYVYCLADGVKLGNHFSCPTEDMVGPLEIRIESAGHDAPKRLADVYKMERESSLNETLPSRELYMQCVPMADPAGQVVTLVAPGKKVLATAKIGALPALSPPWMEFVSRELRHTLEELKTADGKVESLAIDRVVPAAKGVAVPAFDGLSALMWVQTDGTHRPVDFNDDTALPRFADIAGDTANANNGALKISYEKNSIAALSTREFSDVFFADYFLARWWVNGKPLAMGLLELSYERNGGGLVVQCHRARFDLVQTLEALGAKKGDTIAVEFLFCPDGVRQMIKLEERAFPKRDENETTLRVPARSNKIEFKAE